MSTHTPEPWEARLGYVLDKCGDIIVVTWGHKSIPEQDANMQLIAAAPELLKALKNTLLALGARLPLGTEHMHPVIQEAKAVIAKAEGRE